MSKTSRQITYFNVFFQISLKNIPDPLPLKTNVSRQQSWRSQAWTHPSSCLVIATPRCLARGAENQVEIDGVTPYIIRQSWQFDQFGTVWPIRPWRTWHDACISCCPKSSNSIARMGCHWDFGQPFQAWYQGSFPITDVTTGKVLSITSPCLTMPKVPLQNLSTTTCSICLTFFLSFHRVLLLNSPFPSQKVSEVYCFFEVYQLRGGWQRTTWTWTWVLHHQAMNEKPLIHNASHLVT